MMLRNPTGSSRFSDWPKLESASATNASENSTSRKISFVMSSRFLRAYTPSVTITLTVLLDSFCRYPLADLFFGKSTVTPAHVLAGGLIIADINVREFDQVGRIASVLIKSCIQRAIERRPGLGKVPVEQLRPAFLAADEAQAIATSGDVHFQTTAASARGLSLYATQNLPLLYREMGGDSNSRYGADALIGNLRNRFFFGGEEPTTANWMADSIGKIIVSRKSDSQSWNWSPGSEGMGFLLGNRSLSESFSDSEQLDYEVQPRAMSTLRNGGPHNNWMIDAIMTSQGRQFKSSGKRYLLVQFDQRGEGKKGVQIVAPRIPGGGTR